MRPITTVLGNGCATLECIALWISSALAAVQPALEDRQTSHAAVQPALEDRQTPHAAVQSALKDRETPHTAVQSALKDRQTPHAAVQSKGGSHGCPTKQKIPCLPPFAFLAGLSLSGDKDGTERPVNTTMSVTASSDMHLQRTSTFAAEVS